MKIIEIAAMDNGAHRNQTTFGVIPVRNGWAVIPEGMNIPDTFPFVDIEVDGQIVISMTAGTVPDPEPEPEPEPTVYECVSELKSENKLLKAQLQAQTDRTDFLEDCIAEMASVVYE